jgi:hypothetical protein
MRPPIPELLAATPYAALMRECWNEEPANRPSFDDICARLEKLLTELEEKECACNMLRKSVYLSVSLPLYPSDSFLRLPPCSPDFNRRPDGAVTSPLQIANFSMESSISSPR